MTRSSSKYPNSLQALAWELYGGFALLLTLMYMGQSAQAQTVPVVNGNGVQVQVTHSLQHASVADVVGLPAVLPNGLIVTRQASATGSANVNADLTLAGPGCTVNCNLQTVKFVGVQNLSAGASYSGGPYHLPLRAEGATNAAMNILIRIVPVTAPLASAGK